MLGVEAAVHRVDEDERVLGAEVAAAGLFGEHRELLTTLAKPRQLSEDNSLRGSVELQRRVAAGADAQRRAAGLGARNWLHGAPNAVTDAREHLEPLAAGQGPPRTHGEASEFVGICFSAVGRAAWARSKSCGACAGGARRRW